MSGEVISLLNQGSISIGTLLALTIFVGGGLYKLYGMYKTTKQKLEESIQARISADNEKKSMGNEINNLVSSLNNIEKILKQTDARLDGITRRLDANETAMKEFSTTNSETQKTLKKIEGTVELLQDSDKESIRSFILNQYYTWMEQKEIDMYALNTLEYKYNKYCLENGNTFVEGLMTELRKLPRVIKILKDGSDPIKYFEQHPDILDSMRNLNDNINELRKSEK